MESALPAAKHGIGDQARTTLGHTTHASDRRGRPKQVITTDQFRSAAHTDKVRLRLPSALASHVTEPVTLAEPARLVTATPSKGDQILLSLPLRHAVTLHPLRPQNHHHTPAPPPRGR